MQKLYSQRRWPSGLSCTTEMNTQANSTTHHAISPTPEEVILGSKGDARVWWKNSRPGANFNARRHGRAGGRVSYGVSIFVTKFEIRFWKTSSIKCGEHVSTGFRLCDDKDSIDT